MLTHVAWFYGRHGDIGILEPSLQSKGYHDLWEGEGEKGKGGRETKLMLLCSFFKFFEVCGISVFFCSWQV